MKNKAAVIAAVLIGVYAMYAVMQKSESRGIRNNNPLNIRENHEVDFDWDGESLFDTDLEFEEFVSPLWGIRAGARILKNYRDNRGLVTVREIISRWAPPSENDTISYIESVANKIGIGQSEPLLESDYTELIKAMIYHENGSQPYDEQTIMQGFEMGFYS